MVIPTFTTAILARRRSRDHAEQTQKALFRYRIGAFCVCSRGEISP
jgi:hypothetical protein